MGKDLIFLGTYLRRPQSEDGAETAWRVWQAGDGRFLVQRLLRNGEGASVPEAIDPPIFFKEFRIQTAFKPEKAGTRQETAHPEEKKESPRQVAFRNIFDKPETNTLHTAKPATDAMRPNNPPAASPVSDDELNSMFYPRRNIAQSAPDAPASPAKDPASHSDIHRNEKELQKVEKQLRSDFSIALIRLRNNRSLALENLDKILANKAPFRSEHKHMFSDFGTALRRRQLYAMSCRFHERARELAPDDEHILFNLARALYDSGKPAQAKDLLRVALTMAHDFQPGADFLEFIEHRQNSGAK